MYNIGENMKDMTVEVNELNRSVKVLDLLKIADREYLVVQELESELNPKIFFVRLIKDNFNRQLIQTIKSKFEYNQVVLEFSNILKKVLGM
jgi:hypothetical protein